MLNFLKQDTVCYTICTRDSKQYGTTNQSLLSPDQFQTNAPIVTIDCSKQNESVKTSTVDICLEMDFEEDEQAKTSAYCFILLDSVATCTPLTRTVKRVLK